MSVLTELPAEFSSNLFDCRGGEGDGGGTSSLGWSDFVEKKGSLSMLCQIVVGSQFQNFMS